MNAAGPGYDDRDDRDSDDEDASEEFSDEEYYSDEEDDEDEGYDAEYDFSGLDKKTLIDMGEVFMFHPLYSLST